MWMTPRLSSACESNPYSEDHHIPVFLSWMTRQFIALIFNYRNSSSITQIIIISITIGITIWRANNANINSISKIKKSVTNIQPTTHTSSDITTNVPKNDINTFIMFVFVFATILNITNSMEFLLLPIKNLAAH